MKNYLKNEIKHLPFILIVFVLLYGTVTIATSYQYDSGDIRFDNTGTDLESVNVQDALDETFHHVTDYNEIKTTIGNSTLTTTSQTLTGAINELDDQLANISVVGISANYLPAPIVAGTTELTIGTEATKALKAGKYFFFASIPATSMSYGSGSIKFKVDNVSVVDNVVSSTKDVTMFGTFTIASDGSHTLKLTATGNPNGTLTILSYNTINCFILRYSD